METRDYILITISSSAFILSLVSLIITLIQKNRETKRNVKKSMTDTLEGISKINIENTKLRSSKDLDYNSEEAIALRRNWNSQRRVLIAHADFLIMNNDDLATEIECKVLAGAYAAIGEQDKAELFWQRAVEKSDSSVVRCMNLRGFGAFLLSSGKVDLGRSSYDAALGIDLTENDQNKVLKMDTYLMLCESEREYGDEEHFNKSISKALEVLSTIKNVKTKDRMHQRLRSKFTQYESGVKN